MNKYDTVRDIGKDSPAPLIYNNIWVQLVYTINHDGCHKSKLFDYGCLTNFLFKNVYYGFVYLHGIFIPVFIYYFNEV